MFPIRILVAASLFALAGCAATPLKTEEIGLVSLSSRAGDHAPLHVVDARSDTQRTTRNEPLGNMRAVYLGDDRIQPAPLALLGERLGKHLATLTGRDGIRLADFEVRIVDPAGGRPIDQERLYTAAAPLGPMGLAAAPLAGALIGVIENARREFTLRSVIAIDVGEQRYRGVSYRSARQVTEAEIAATIEAALKDLDAQLTEAGKSKP